MQHTPGPWHVIRLSRPEIGERAIIDSDGDTVCNPSPMGEANARLIAAAPAMLAALQEIATHTRRSTLNPADIVPSAAAVIARAAIAQAEGDA